jgi:uncharacterized protein YndB with AHSA1/START domain
VFQAIADGRLMLNTGVWPGTLNWKCEKGASYSCAWNFEGKGILGKGVFTEVNPFDKIAFTWTEKNNTESLVEITLQTVGNFTKVVIVQSGLSDVQLVADVIGGWSDSLDGLRDDLDSVCIRKSSYFKQSPEKVFEAISKGILFACCGSDINKLKIDFVEGGYYRLGPSDSESTHGKFTKITQHSVIKCTWRSGGCGETKYDTGETELRLYLTPVNEPAGQKTRLDLVHDGFVDIVAANDHNEGWNDVLEDFVSRVSKDE